MVVMNKLMLTVLAASALFGSCSKDDDDKIPNTEELVSPELLNMAVSSTTAFTGGLMVYPCMPDTSIYIGNYNKNGQLSVINANYTVVNGLATSIQSPVRLPVGDYNFLYWGVLKNSQVDSTYDASSVTEPGLRQGANLAELFYSLRKESYSDTTYTPVYDFVHAVQTLHVGTDKMEATLQRAVAGLRVTILNYDGSTMDSSIASCRILVSSIAGKLNYYTAEPSDFSKTVAFPLTVSGDSLTMSANSTVMLFPSGDAPELSILLNLKNGQEKIYRKPLAGPLAAGTRLVLRISLGDLFVEEGSSHGFEVKDWNEKTESLDFPVN